MRIVTGRRPYAPLAFYWWTFRPAIVGQAFRLTWMVHFVQRRQHRQPHWSARA